jgi:hypothetical protein
MSNEHQITTATGMGEIGFISEVELLKRIPISRRTAFTWVQTGKLPCVKIGRRKLFHWPSCEAALLRLQRGTEIA